MTKDRILSLFSWNVNGMRAILKKNFLEFLDRKRPDVLCLQETKISNGTREKENLEIPGYRCFWNGAERPGYSGTATLIRESLFRDGEDFAVLFSNGFGSPDFDSEGRIQVFLLAGFYLVNVYFPNAGEGLVRLQYKLDFNDYLLKHLKKMEKKHPVVLCGDFNVAHREIDLARPKQNEGNAGYTPEERAWMDKFLRSGFRDTFRHFYPEEIQYSWWSYRFQARKKNIGWRIDYFCVSEAFIRHAREALILNEIEGSDHCPVALRVSVA